MPYSVFNFNFKKKVVFRVSSSVIIIWLHGAGGFGADKSIKNFFSSSEFRHTKWFFPTTPSCPVTYANGDVMPVWFDIYKMPITSEDYKIIEAVKFIHEGNEKVHLIRERMKTAQSRQKSYADRRRRPLEFEVGDLTPILWSHGTSDGIVLFEAGQAGPPFLAQAGISCEFKAYRGLGHSFSHDELKSVASWMQVRLMSSSSSSS
ncbi:hypothetical protein ACHQM5_025596 [Ranunculus cassubicifolius]